MRAEVYERCPLFYYANIEYKRKLFPIYSGGRIIIRSEIGLWTMSLLLANFKTKIKFATIASLSLWRSSFFETSHFVEIMLFWISDLVSRSEEDLF